MPYCRLGPGFSEYGSGTSSISIICDSIKNAESQALLPTY